MEHVVPHEFMHMLYHEHPADDSLSDGWNWHNEGMAECGVRAITGDNQSAINFYVQDPFSDIAPGLSFDTSGGRLVVFNQNQNLNNPTPEPVGSILPPMFRGKAAASIAPPPAISDEVRAALLAKARLPPPPFNVAGDSRACATQVCCSRDAIE